MDTDDIDLILIDIIKEFTQPENLHILDSQKLASSIFFSFAVGVLKNDDDVEEKLKKKAGMIFNSCFFLNCFIKNGINYLKIVCWD